MLFWGMIFKNLQQFVFAVNKFNFISFAQFIQIQLQPAQSWFKKSNENRRSSHLLLDKTAKNIYSRQYTTFPDPAHAVYAFFLGPSFGPWLSICLGRCLSVRTEDMSWSRTDDKQTSQLLLNSPITSQTHAEKICPDLSRTLSPPSLARSLTFLLHQ